MWEFVNDSLTHGGNLDTIWAQKICWLNFLRILWFFWDLGHRLLIIPMDAAFAEILIFSNNFGFSSVNWAPKWTKTVNSSCIRFEPKFKILDTKIFQTLCFSYWRLPMVKVSARSNNIWGSKDPNFAKRGHFMGTESIKQILKIFNFTTTYAILMKLTTDIYLNNVFH